MNFLEAEVNHHNLVEFAGKNLGIGAVRSESGEVTLGVRPEDIQLATSTEGLPVRVASVEYQGTYLRALCEPKGWAAKRNIKVDIPIQRLAEKPILPGCEAHLQFDHQSVHVFQEGAEV